MEARVAKLEASLDHVSKDVTELRSDAKEIRDRMKGLEVKVDHLPGKGFVVTATIAALMVVAALVTFGEKLQGLVSP